MDELEKELINSPKSEEINSRNDMDLINSMFDVDYPNVTDNNSPYYYVGFGEYIIKKLSIKNFFYFFKTLCKNINLLSNDQKNEIINELNIEPKEKVIYKDKIIYKEKPIYKKPRLNSRDDY